MTISIIITIIACVSRWRLIQQSLQFYRLRTSTSLVLIGLSMLWVASIISFPHLYQWIYTQSWTQPLTNMSALRYIWYITIISLIISMVVFYRAGRQIAYYQLYLIVILIIISIWFPQLGRYPLYYYLLAAGVEEYIKYYIGYGSFKLYGTTGSDIILFGLLSGLGFACIENIVYLSNMSSDVAIISNNLARRIIGPIVHMIYSWWLAYGYWHLYRRGWGAWGVMMSAFVVILVHTRYNSYVVHAWWWLIMIVLILWYVGISWMIYQCDRLYFVAKNNLKTTSQ